jgi:acetoin utilization deacetylase AcuC-like enzyme
VHLAEHHTEFFILECGADSIASDLLADMRFSAAAHRHATRRLIALADRQVVGRFMVFGCCGYVPNKIASARTALLRELTHADSYPLVGSPAGHVRHGRVNAGQLSAPVRNLVTAISAGSVTLGCPEQ